MTNKDMGDKLKEKEVVLATVPLVVHQTDRIIKQLEAGSRIPTNKEDILVVIDALKTIVDTIVLPIYTEHKTLGI